MRFQSRFGVTARVRLIIVLALLGNLLLACAGLYFFSLYEQFRLDFSQVEIPLVDSISEVNRELASLQIDFTHLIEDGKAGQVDEAAVYRRGRTLVDRADALGRRLAGMGPMQVHIPNLDLRRFEAELGGYRSLLVSGVEMMSVDLASAETYAARAAKGAFAVNQAAAEVMEQVHHHMDDDSQALRDRLQRLAQPVAFLLLLVVAVVFLLLQRLAGSITQAFHSVRHTLGRLRAGEMDFDIVVPGASLEAREVATCLETFRHTLRELAAMRADLESQVEDRTRRLSEANRELADKLARLTATERELRLYKQVFENTAEAIVITELDGTIVDVNDAYSAITGYSRADVVGRNPRITNSGLHDAAFYGAMWRDIIENGRWVGEIWDKRRNGQVFPKLLSISTVFDSEHKPVNYVGVFTDISELKEAEKNLEQLAYFDRLTGLPNRRLLQDRIEHTIALSKRSGRHGALFFVDMDHFKRVNDTLGHQVGDQLLVDVATRLKGCVRASDTVGRLAGDEFVVLAYELPEDPDQAAVQARMVGAKIIRTLEDPYELEGKEFHCSCSIGVILFRGDGTGLEGLLAKADTAMYEAKKAGRNTLRFFDPVMQHNLQARVALENSLRAAVREERFCLHLQPQFDARQGIVGVEALIRWNDPERGQVPPVEFIPLAEEIHLIQEIGRWVLNQACRKLKAWEGDSRLARLSMAVNISGQHFARKDFVDEVHDIVSRHGIRPSQLKLELTESVVMGSLDESVAKMRQLQAMGIRLAMDDFGTGYSSLAYLRRLPFDQIKIDRSFVSHMLENQNDRFIVRAVLTMAGILGIEAVAEGVETREQQDILVAMGCRQFQGYYFSRPLPIEACEAFALERMGEETPIV